MILHWNELVAAYGVDVVPHRQKFESADWATYAMFCSRLLNRLPCRECTKLPIVSLNALAVRMHAEFPEIQVILACRGAYLGKAEADADGEAWYRQATTTGDLRRLDDAGWRVCVLQVGQQLPTRGRWLLEAIKRLPRNASSVRNPVIA